MEKIDAKVIAKQVEIVSSNNRSNRYGLTFKIDSFQDKLGVYLGTYDQATNDKLITKIDTAGLYTFIVDPTVLAGNGINLGVRAINFKGKTIYKESNKFNLFGGAIFTTLGVIGLFLMSKNKRVNKAS